jgi:hypothetical protein
MRSVFTDVFPAQSDPALAAVNVPDCVLTGRHCTITGFSFRDVNTVGETFSGSCVNPEHNDPRRCSLHFIKEISPAVLAVESSGYHGMNGGKMGLACRAAINALAREVTTIAHTHGSC